MTGEIRSGVAVSVRNDKLALLTHRERVFHCHLDGANTSDVHVKLDDFLVFFRRLGGKSLVKKNRTN